jgi:putative flippase GtrA
MKLRFIAVGAVNTIFGYSVYAALVTIGIPFQAALLTATIVGAIFNCLAFGAYVFNTRSSLVVFVRFFLVYTGIYFLNALLLDSVLRWITSNVYLAQIFCLPVSIIFSWISMNFWVYKKSA